MRLSECGSRRANARSASGVGVADDFGIRLQARGQAADAIRVGDELVDAPHAFEREADQLLLGGFEGAATTGEQQIEGAGRDRDGLEDLLVDLRVVVEQLLAREIEADAPAPCGGFDAGDCLAVGFDFAGEERNLLSGLDGGRFEVLEDAFDRREDLLLLDLGGERRRSAIFLAFSRWRCIRSDSAGA